MIKDDMRVCRGTLGHREITFLASQAMFYDRETEVEFVWDNAQMSAPVSTETMPLREVIALSSIRDVTEL